MKLGPVDDGLVISVTLIAKTEGLKQNDADSRVPNAVCSFQMKSEGS
jgi:hypothetical protein